MDITRRKFLKYCGQAAILLGLEAWLPKAAAAADGTVPLKFLRHIITADAASSRTIMWQANANLSGCALEYRPAGQIRTTKQVAASTTSLFEDKLAVFFSSVTLTELAPDTSYEYRIIQGERATRWHQFKTEPANRTEVSALIFCDSQCSGSYDIWQQTFQTAWQRHPESQFAAIVGDLTDNGQSDWHWDNFFAAMGTIPEQHPLVPVMGNHECYGLDWKFCLPRRYLASFALPTNNSAKFQGSFYTFDYGPVHFIVLNTQELELHELLPGLLERQLHWLKQDTNRRHQPWQVVLMHKDILAYDEYQLGTQQKGGISDIGHAFMPVFDELGIDLVLTGHMHTYRSRGHIKDLQPADDGPFYVLSGPAGNRYYQVPDDRTYDRSAIYQPTPPHYLRLHATAQELTLTGCTTDGEHIETITLTK